MKDLIRIFEDSFDSLHVRSVEYVESIPEDNLFLEPDRGLTDPSIRMSCGELIIRSAGSVEQAFGGITARLWDDPFEWTLPEELSTIAKIVDYLAVVEEGRKRGFIFFTSDTDLYKQIPAPEQLRPIAALLLESISRAEHFLGQAFVIRRICRQGHDFPEDLY